MVLFLALEAVLGVLLSGGIAWEGHAGALVFGFAAAPAIMRLPLPGRRSPRLRSLAGWKDLLDRIDSILFPPILVYLYVTVFHLL